MTEYQATSITRQVGVNIRVIRDEKNLSQKDLALKSGMSQASISKMENAKLGIAAEDVFRVARALGAPLESFYVGVDVPESTDPVEKEIDSQLEELIRRIRILLREALMRAITTPRAEARELPVETPEQIADSIRRLELLGQKLRETQKLRERSRASSTNKENAGPRPAGQSRQASKSDPQRTTLPSAKRRKE